MREIKLYIAVPSCRDWKPQFGSSLITLIQRLYGAPLAGYKLLDVHCNTVIGASCLSRAREKAIAEAKSMGFTHLLFLDDDMVFPHSVVETLLGHDKAVVGADYAKKMPGQPHRTASPIEDGELVRVNGMGMGMVLIDIEKIKAVPSPLFAVPWNEDRQDYVGEDVFFIAKLKSCGVESYCDLELSKQIGHVGDYEYRLEYGAGERDFYKRREVK